MSNFKSQEGAKASFYTSLPTPMVVYSVNVGEFMSWLTFA